MVGLRLYACKLMTNLPKGKIINQNAVCMHMCALESNLNIGNNNICTTNHLPILLSDGSSTQNWILAYPESAKKMF